MTFGTRARREARGRVPSRRVNGYQEQAASPSKYERHMQTYRRGRIELGAWKVAYCGVDRSTIAGKNFCLPVFSTLQSVAHAGRPREYRVHCNITPLWNSFEAGTLNGDEWGLSVEALSMRTFGNDIELRKKAGSVDTTSPNILV